MDFTGKTVLVVGGSSGIGNGIAQAFRAQGATVYVWGTREASEYRVEDGSDLRGLNHFRLDVGDFNAITDFKPPFSRLDVLVTCQGAIAYKRREFEMPTFEHVVRINLSSVMACCMLSSSKSRLACFSFFSKLIDNRWLITRRIGGEPDLSGIRIEGIHRGAFDEVLVRHRGRIASLGISILPFAFWMRAPGPTRLKAASRSRFGASHRYPGRPHPPLPKLDEPVFDTSITRNSCET